MIELLGFLSCVNKGDFAQIILAEWQQFIVKTRLILVGLTYVSMTRQALYSVDFRLIVFHNVTYFEPFSDIL